MRDVIRRSRNDAEREKSLVSDMMTNGDKDKERIDLGLGTILSGAATEQVREVTLGEPKDIATTPTWSLGGDEQLPAKSEFEKLADERKWADIIALAESRFGDGTDCEPKLWWIRAHLGAFSMPVSYLAAPLESLCKMIVGKELPSSVKSLLHETGLLALSRLREVADIEQTKRLREALAEIGVTEPKGPEARMRKNTSSFRTLDIPSSEATTISPASPPVEKIGTRSRRVVFTGMVAALVAMLFVFDTPVRTLFTAPLDIASESFVQDSSFLEQSVAPLSRRDPGGRLGALFYSIGETAQTPAQGAASQQSVLDAPSVAKSEPEIPVERERINTSGPIESPEFRNRADRRYQDGQSESLESHDVHESRPREDLRGGPPQAVLPQSGTSSGSGSTYRVLARTSVVSSPSLGGRVIGVLEPGDRVLVEGRVGKWLKLRSKKGRGGYAPAEDVEEIPEFNSQRSPQ